jgi:hypothetical protein
MGLPSHPKDVAAKPKVARAFVVVARKASKKLSSVETGAILARSRPDVTPAAIAKLVDSIHPFRLWRVGFSQEDDP